MTFLKSSRRDIRCLSAFYTICSFLLIVPPYNFDNKYHGRPLFIKIKAIILLLLIGTISLYSIIMRHQYYSNLFTQVHLILDYIDEFFVVMIPFAVISNSAFFIRTKWIKLNSHVEYVDEAFENRGHKYQIFYRNIYLQTILYLFGYTIAVFSLVQTWVDYVGFEALQGYSMHLFCALYDALVHVLIINLALVLKIRFSDLGDYFESLEGERIDTNYVIGLRKIENISQTLIEAVNLFNSVFGTPLIFLTGKSISDLLNCINFVTSSKQAEDEHFRLRMYYVISFVVVYRVVIHKKSLKNQFIDIFPDID